MTSPLCDALAGMFKRTTAQLWASLSWPWVHQGALQLLPPLQTSSSNGAWQQVPEMSCNPKSGCCRGTAELGDGCNQPPALLVLPWLLGTAPAPAWLYPCRPARARGLRLSLAPHGCPLCSRGTGAAECTLWGRYGQLMLLGLLGAPLLLTERKQPAHLMMMPKIWLGLHAQLG